MVLVHVTAFRGCHKIHDQWENRKYVVEKQSYPNVQSMWYASGIGKGTVRPYIGNYFLPISPNLEQG